MTQRGVKRHLSLLTQKSVEARDRDWINWLIGGLNEKRVSIFHTAVVCDSLHSLATPRYVCRNTAFIHQLGRLHRIRTVGSAGTSVCSTLCRLPSIGSFDADRTYSARCSRMDER